MNIPVVGHAIFSLLIEGLMTSLTLCMSIPVDEFKNIDEVSAQKLIWRVTIEVFLIFSFSIIDCPLHRYPCIESYLH